MHSPVANLSNPMQFHAIIPYLFFQIFQIELSLSLACFPFFRVCLTEL